MKISVISATYNRAALLDHALTGYAAQTLPYQEWEYLICDDMSDDDTARIVKKWSKTLPLRYFTAEELGYPKQPGQWRDGCTLRNAVSTYATGEVLLATHPEIIPTPHALDSMYEAAIANPEAWITAIPYWMPYGSLPSGWKKDIYKICTMQGFYDPNYPYPPGKEPNPFYSNQNQEVRTTWESEVFWAMTMAKWRWMGGFRNFTTWGSVDMDFWNRRNRLGIKTVLCSDRAPSQFRPHHDGYLMVFHQNHESKRDMEAANRALAGANYTTPDAARRAGGLFAVYNHGHRERATDGKLGGILLDHLARYQFAAKYAQDKVVADVPCGTGYGGMILSHARRYIGIDLDEESIQFAKWNYHQDYRAGNMTKLPLEDASVDMLLSFEGLEHISFPDQLRFSKEIERVVKPGGTIIVSTPQIGAASGTPWDRYMLSSSGLVNLFARGGWTNIDLFYQPCYGAPGDPIFANRFGEPDFQIEIPKGAQIMVLGATRL